MIGRGSRAASHHSDTSPPRTVSQCAGVPLVVGCVPFGPASTAGNAALGYRRVGSGGLGGLRTAALDGKMGRSWHWDTYTKARRARLGLGISESARV